MPGRLAVSARALSASSSSDGRSIHTDEELRAGVGCTDGLADLSIPQLHTSHLCIRIASALSGLCVPVHIRWVCCVSLLVLSRRESPSRCRA